MIENIYISSESEINQLKKCVQWWPVIDLILNISYLLSIIWLLLFTWMYDLYNCNLIIGNYKCWHQFNTCIEKIQYENDYTIACIHDDTNHFSVLFNLALSVPIARNWNYRIALSVPSTRNWNYRTGFCKARAHTTILCHTITVSRVLCRTSSVMLISCNWHSQLRQGGNLDIHKYVLLKFDKKIIKWWLVRNINKSKLIHAQLFFVIQIFFVLFFWKRKLPDDLLW